DRLPNSEREHGGGDRRGRERAYEARRGEELLERRARAVPGRRTAHGDLVVAAGTTSSSIPYATRRLDSATLCTRSAVMSRIGRRDTIVNAPGASGADCGRSIAVVQLRTTVESTSAPNTTR